MIGQLKFSDALITIIPGGSFLAALYLAQGIIGVKIPLPDVSGFGDLFQTVIFLGLSLIVGEILQSIAHKLERLIDIIFFKGYRPSEIFLFKNNPILSDFQIQSLSSKEQLPSEVLSESYEDVSRVWKVKSKSAKSQRAHQVFRRLYTPLKSNESVSRSNSKYLYCRVTLISLGLLFLISLYALCINGLSTPTVLMSVLLLFAVLLFLDRTRGVAKGLLKEVYHLTINNHE